ELYARAERYADERQKGDLRATAEAARGRVEQYLRRAADKRGAIERAAAECEAEVLSVKASVNAEKNKNADAMRDLDDKRRAMRERHARENRNCAERINRAAAEKANYTAARNDRKKLNRLFAASVAVGIVFYAVLFVAVIALVSEKAGNPYLPLYLTGALGAGLFLGWVGGRVSERIKAWKNKGFIFLCIRCVAGLFYLIGKYALLVPFGIVYAKGRYDRATAARLKKYDEEIRTAQDTRDRSAARQRGQAADLDAQITALAVFKGKAVKRLTELDGILAGLRQNAPIGFRDGIVSAAEAERRLQACDEHLTGIKNVRAYVAKMKNGGQVGNR
ncbi:MAG: hypothetical protein LBL66_00710, partial [Clostridiales bacterium]|nr:hypothetical protein [Clostridiales bacterium]